MREHLVIWTELMRIFLWGVISCYLTGDSHVLRLLNLVYLFLMEIFRGPVGIWCIPHTPTHKWGSLHRSWIFKQNWNILIRSRFIQFLVIWPNPTQPPIHPPMGGGVSTDVESSNRIEISWFILNLLNFYWNELPMVNPYSLRYKYNVNRYK